MSASDSAVHVDLSQTGLREFPRRVFDYANTLEILDLSGNGMTDLPDDMGRLTRLRALFCSGNPFTRLPPSLGACPALRQIGFRGCSLREIPSEALPPALRWLTLTDNHLETLPAALGERPDLQKLMLAGNRLASLPDTLAQAKRLELIRLSANRFDRLPPWLTTLPRLAWAAWAGNPFETTPSAPWRANIPWSQIECGARLGEGASGTVHAAQWRYAGAPDATPVALKFFKGAMTSDGLPGSEMTACLAAGDHPNLVGGLGRLTGHPDAIEGLIMPRVPESWRILAGPPSLATCSRDVYEPTLRLPIDVALRIARDIAKGAEHLHRRGLSHGDLYAHNILWDGTRGEARLSDFGAASFMPLDDTPGLDRLDVLAWGILLSELLDRATGDSADDGRIETLISACLASDPAARPRMIDIATRLDAMV